MLRIGSVMFQGQYQMVLGTTLVVPTKLVTSGGTVNEAASVTSRKIVFRLVSGDLTSIAVRK